MAPTEEPERRRLLLPDVRATAQHIGQCGYQTVIDATEDRKIEYYWQPLFKAADAARDRNDEDSEHALVLLACVVSMYYDPEDTDEPLKPVFQSSSGRSAALSDFSDDQLNALEGVLPGMEDDELVARVADVLWLRRSDHKAANVAAAAYLRSARRLMHPENWVRGFQRLKRSLQIAASLGKKNSVRREIVDYALELLETLDGKDPLYLTRSVIELLLDFREGDPKALAAFAEKGANEALSKPNPMRAADYFEAQTRCLERSGDRGAARDARIAQAEAYAAVGEGMFATGNPALAASHWIEMAIHALDAAGGMQDRKNELVNRLHEIQLVSREHMSRIETKVELDPKIIEPISSVKGMSFRDGLLFLAQLAISYSMEQLRNAVIEQHRDHPLSTVFARTLIRDDGKTDITLPPLELRGELNEDHLRLHMWHRASQGRGITAWMINEARKILKSEHPAEERDLEWLLQGNAFVPAGRESIYERAILAGVDGDYLVATHLLLPQLEQSFRYVLNQHGVVTTYIQLDGTHHEQPLHDLIRRDTFVEVFGQEATFDLRGLLVEKAGSNLRNATAHGLRSADSFGSADCIYLFALTIKLLAIGMQKPEEGSPSPG